ncbi:MAG: ABC transporter permease, partial [Microbacterium sp.]|nr:ABC transporter permease [Microbacterium sp.]
MLVPADVVPSLVGVVVLTAIATVVLVLFRVPASWTPALAIARGTVQLAVISVILTGIIESPSLIAGALCVMFAVAVGVAAGRIGMSGRSLAIAATSIAAGVVVACAVVFATGALALTSRYALA